MQVIAITVLRCTTTQPRVSEPDQKSFCRGHLQADAYVA
jgi:hypothetical protein